MKRESLIKGILSALVIGILFGTAFFLLNNHSAEKFVVSNQNPIVYHDARETLPDDSKKEATVSNILLGSAEIGDKTLNLVENADYSLLKDNLSVTHGMNIGKAGFTYVYAFENNVANAEKSGISITFNEEKHMYTLVKKYQFNNENEVTLQDYDASGKMVLYYQKTDEYGLLDEYEAMLFKEVE